MKILMAASCSSNPNLGVPGVMHSLADEYRKLGHEVRLRFRDEPGRLAELLFGLRLARSEDARWADVIDCHAVEAWPMCVRSAGKIVVARSHGLEAVVHRRQVRDSREGRLRLGLVYWTYRGSVRLWQERQSIRNSDASIILNQGDFDLCLKEFRASPDRLHLLPNGYPCGFLEKSIAPLETSKIAFIGSWLPRKGNDVAVKALSEVLRSHPKARVVIAGTGQSKEIVAGDFPKDVQAQLEILPKFSRHELPSLIEGCGILAFPSRSEGYPLSLVEAMACGLCPVASAIPGVVDVVRDGENGLLVETENSSEMAHRISELLDNPQRLHQLRIQARESVRATSWDKLAVTQSELYARLLQNKIRQDTRP